MEEKKSSGREPDSKRLEALRMLPEKIMRNLTREEIDAFLHKDEWPDSLREKLKDYLMNID